MQIIDNITSLNIHDKTLITSKDPQKLIHYHDFVVMGECHQTDELKPRFTRTQALKQLYNKIFVP